MTMHLVGPWLSTTNSRKHKLIKFRSATHKAQYLREQEELAKLLKKHNIQTQTKRQTKSSSLVDVQTYHRETKHVPSLNTHNMSPCFKKEPNKYTGTLIRGIATMHKSNAVPIINKEQACEIANMRR